MTIWPKRPDGTNKTMGEMTPEERREQFEAAAQRLKAELESPEMQRVIAESIPGGEPNRFRIVRRKIN